MDYNALGGWFDDPKIIEETYQAVGDFYGNAPWSPGIGKGKILILWDAVKRLFGKPFSYRPQTRGTCVGRAGGRCGDLIQALEIVEAGRSAKLWRGKISSEAVYALARVEIGQCRIYGDGAVVAYGVEAVRRYGFLPRGRYEIDGQTFVIPEEDDDSLAASWGSCRKGLPDPLEKIAANTKVQKYAVVRTYEEARDAIASGFPVWFGTSQAFWYGLPARRDGNGFLAARGRTAHSWIACGIWDEKGAILLDNKSWGDDWVDGPKGLIDIPDGCYWATGEDFELAIKKGEAYAISTVGFAQPRKIDYLLL